MYQLCTNTGQKQAAGLIKRLHLRDDLFDAEKKRIRFSNW
jgi:hypothetical protein